MERLRRNVINQHFAELHKVLPEMTENSKASKVLLAEGRGAHQGLTEKL